MKNQNPFEWRLRRIAKKGIVYKYALKTEDINKMPRFRYKATKINMKHKAFKKFQENHGDMAKWMHKDQYVRLWGVIVSEMFKELEDNPHGILLPLQLGELFIGIPINHTYMIMKNAENLKYFIWRNTDKYSNKNLRYYFINVKHGRYDSAKLRSDFYKQAPIYSKKSLRS